MKKTILFTCMAVMGISLSAQQNKISKANQKQDDLAFVQSIEMYKKSLKSGADTSSVAVQLANCYYKTSQLEEAATWYGFADQQTIQAEEVFRYAQSLKATGNYREADRQMDRFAEIQSADSRAKHHIENRDYLTKLKAHPDRFTMAPAGINSATSEFSPAYHGDQIVFVAARDAGELVKRKWLWDDSSFLNLFSASKNEDGNLTNIAPFSSELNSAMHEGPMTFSADGNTMYFTRNNHLNGKTGKSEKNIIKLNLYSSTYNGENWSKPAAFEFNNDDYSTGHPSLSADGTKLYLASDMPGGFGGVDLYVCTKQPDGSWSAPTNLGAEINTEGNEVFPFVHQDGNLYFASNGLVGLGGLDVFQSKLKNGALSTPKNLGFPLNSEKDDFGFILDQNGTDGFVSSNRKGGQGQDDIYAFTMKPSSGLMLDGVVVNKVNNTPINGAKAQLFDNMGALVSEQTLGESGTFSFELNDAICEYTVRVNNGDTWSDFTSDKTPCDHESDEINLGNIALEEMMWGAEGTIKDKETKAPLEGFTISITNLDNQTVDTRISDADGFTSFALEKDVNYEIRFDKDGYFSKSAKFTTFGVAPGIRDIEKLTSLNLSFESFEIGQEIKIDNIYYDYNKSSIREDAKLELDKVVKVLLDNPTINIEMGSHTDARGSDSYNLSLSQKRAKAAMTYLIQQGIAAERLTWNGYGETKLVNDCGNGNDCSDELHEANRRTVFKVLSL